MTSKRKYSTIDSDSVEGSLPKKPRNHQTPTGPTTTTTTTETTSTSTLVPSDIKTQATDEAEKLGLVLEATQKRLEQAEEDSKRKSALLSHIHKLVECAICKDYLREPYTLQCGHSACKICLQTWWSESGNNKQPEGREDISTNTGTGGETVEQDVISTSLTEPHQMLKCIECRQLVRHRPVLDYRLKHIVEALASTRQPQRDASDSGQEDVWRRFFPPADGLSMRTAQQYIPTVGAQGQIQTPLPTFSSSRDRSGAGQRRTERRSYTYPYNQAGLLQRRGDRYDPVREAPSEMQQRREHQRHSRAPSSPLLRTPTTHELGSDFGPSLQAFENPRVSVFEPQLQPHLPSPRTSPRQLSLTSQSQPNSQLRLPSIRELYLLPSPSDVILAPIIIRDSSPSLNVLNEARAARLGEGSSEKHGNDAGC